MTLVKMKSVTSAETEHHEAQNGQHLHLCCCEHRAWCTLQKYVMSELMTRRKAQ